MIPSILHARPGDARRYASEEEVELVDNEWRQAIALLTHRHSPKRRAGARKLRKLKDPRAGLEVFKALQKEVDDPRTWETQYQMIMALGECGCEEALPFLQALTQREFEATILYLALGDAIVRLARKHREDARPVLGLLRSDNEMLIDGGLRAVAMLRLKLNTKAIAKIIAYGSKLRSEHANRFWIAAAAAGWGGSQVEKFLHECVAGGREDVERAASASLKKKYLNWRPL